MTADVLVQQIAAVRRDGAPAPLRLDAGDLQSAVAHLRRTGLTPILLAAMRDGLFQGADDARAPLARAHEGAVAAHLVRTWCTVVATVALAGDDIAHALATPHVLGAEHVDGCRGVLTTTSRVIVRADDVEHATAVVLASLAPTTDVAASASGLIEITTRHVASHLQIVAAPAALDDQLWHARERVALGAEDRWALDAPHALLCRAMLPPAPACDPIADALLLLELADRATEPGIGDVVALAERAGATPQLADAASRAVAALALEPSTLLERWAADARG